MKKIIASLATFLAALAFVIPLSAPMSADAQSAPSFCYTFSQNLGLGRNLSTQDAQALTQALTNAGVWNNGAITSYNENVAAAVSGFQEKYASQILTPNGLTYGTGFVGDATRAELNSLYRCSSNNSSYGNGNSAYGHRYSRYPQSNNGQPSGPTQCPVGYTCTPINPAPVVCPIGYTCIPINSPSNPVLNNSTQQNDTVTLSAVSPYSVSGDTSSYYVVPADSSRTFSFTLASNISSGPGEEYVNQTQTINLNGQTQVVSLVSPSSYQYGADTATSYALPNGSVRTFSFTINTGSSQEYVSPTQTISVLNNAGGSGQAPSISLINTPSALSVGQIGTWTVNATDPQNSSLSYSVNWGDYTSPLVNGAEPSSYTQSTAFTHSYSNPGTYTVTFSVTDGYGLTSQATSLVTVGGSSTSGSSDQANLSLDGSNPGSNTVATSLTNNGYLGLPVLVFDTEAQGDSLHLHQIVVNFATNNNSPGTLQTAYLYQGSYEITSAPVVGGTATFNISDGTAPASIPINASVPYTVKVDVANVTSGTFTVTASVNAGNQIIYNSVDATALVAGSVGGNIQTVSSNGNSQSSSVTLATPSTPTIQVSGTNQAGETSALVATFTMDITAQGGTMTEPSSGDFVVMFTNSSGQSYQAPNLSVVTIPNNDIAQGSTASVTVTAEIPNSSLPATGLYNAAITSFHWNINGNSTVQTYGLDSFQTTSPASFVK